MTFQVRFQRLTVAGFRNIDAIELEPAPRINVIFGDNGQGKTSLLEALYCVATTRSFRAERLRELIREGTESATVSARTTEDGLVREQRVSLRPNGRTVTFDRKRPESLASYATRTPVVVFHPGDLALASGPASGRRRLLDRIALFFDPSSADHRHRYERSLKARLVTLEQRGTQGAELFALEELMAQHGAQLTSAREQAAERLEHALRPAFLRLAASDLRLAQRFVPGGCTDPARFALELERRRGEDRRRGSTSFGPQRDDLELLLDARPVRRHASQGQQRILTLALKWAELDCVRQARGAHPVLLLDDVSSELDPTRTGAVYELVRQTESQLFVTTTRPELFSTPGTDASGRADFKLAAGAIVR